MTYVTIIPPQPQDEIALLEVLEELRIKGNVSPESLVDAARPANSPIHHLFEWDDAVAGERYRLEQARLYIAKVEYVPAPEREPILVEMPRVQSRATKLDVACLTGVDLTMCSIERLQAELQDIQKRYANCSHLAPVVEGTLSDAVQELTKLAMDLPIPEETEHGDRA
jgi:hypothetical protein